MKLNKIIQVSPWINVFVISKLGNFSYVFVFGVFGFLKVKFRKKINILSRYKKIRLYGNSPSLYYTNIKILKNLFSSVLSGHIKFLELRGVGFKYKIKDNKLFLVLGYSHVIYYEIPNNISVQVINNKLLKLYGNNLQIINKVIYDLKKLKVFNVYKGKGIVLKGETLLLKEGKKSSNK